MTRVLQCILLLPLLFWTGCATPSLPLPQQSGYFQTVESGFRIWAREGIIRYTVLLEREEAVSQPLSLEVRYENPADPADPFIEEVVWPAEDDLLRLESPPLTGLEPDRYYRIEIVILDEAEAEEADFHEVFIFSTIDTRSYGR